LKLRNKFENTKKNGLKKINPFLSSLFFLLDQKEPKSQGILRKLKRKSFPQNQFFLKRFILKASKNVILSVIYFTSVT
jgi:hypothetical protein